MLVDPRGQRFAATITSLVLAAVLLSGGWISTALLAAQLVVFATGAVLGLQASPYAWLFRSFVRPRLSPPSELEDARPPRFAQGVGLVFAAVGLVGFATGATVVGVVAVALALGAAFLNAAFGFCLGCEIYLLARRVVSSRALAAR